MFRALAISGIFRPRLWRSRARLGIALVVPDFGSDEEKQKSEQESGAMHLSFDRLYELLLWLERNGGSFWRVRTFSLFTASIAACFVCFSVGRPNFRAKILTNDVHCFVRPCGGTRRHVEIGTGRPTVGGLQISYVSPASSGLPPPCGVERRFSVVTGSGALLATGYFLPASPG